MSRDAPPWPPHAPCAFFFQKDPVSGFQVQPKPRMASSRGPQPCRDPISKCGCIPGGRESCEDSSPLQDPVLKGLKSLRHGCSLRPRKQTLAESGLAQRLQLVWDTLGASAAWCPEGLRVTGFSRKGHWLGLEVS